MYSKILRCTISSYYDFDREEHWLKIFRAKIDSNQDIDGELENGGEQAEHAFTLHYANLLLYAIANGKTISTNSILNYINLNENEYFFSVCGTYFESDKYKGDAYRIITFLKEKNILKDFLKKYFNDEIAEKLSRKDEVTNKYLYDDGVVFYALRQKHKIDKIKSINCSITYIPSIVCIVSVALLSISIGHLICPGLSISEIFNQPLTAFPLYAALGVLGVGIIASVVLYCVENNFPAEKMQQKLDAEQNSQVTASSEEQKVEEQTPTTVLEIRLPRELRDPDTSFGDAVGKGIILGGGLALLKRLW